ncbi:MAG: vWA domain-containing protein, partial [Planctomycetota bacterium]
DLETLTQLAPPNRKPIRLKGLAFRELFSWLSNTMKLVSSSTPGELIAPEDPVEAGWAEISV